MEMYDLIAERYSEIFPLEFSKIDFFNQLFKKRKASVLDIGCATGDLAFSLEKIGFDVAGIDLNAKMIEIANKRKDRFHSNIDFQVLNMLEMDHKDRWDYVLCLGNTLPHLQSEEQLFSFLITQSKLIKKDGIFVCQLLNYDKILDDRNVEFETIKLSDLSFERTYSFIKEGLIEFTIKIKKEKDNKVFSDSTRLLPIRSSVLTDMLYKAGFSKVDCYSNFKMKTFLKGDFSQIFVAFK